MNAPGQIIDLKFLNDDILLALWEYKGGNGNPVLISMRFRASFKLGERSATRLDFDEDLSSFAPIGMQAFPQNDSRGGVPARVCLLGKDEVAYKVFALPDDGVGNGLLQTEGANVET